MSFFIIDQIGYELESKLLFRNMDSPPDSARKRIINNLIKKLKSDGNWNLIDAFWVMGAHHQQAARLNWKNPKQYALTEVNSPTWTADQGYAGNGTTSYLNSNFNPSTNGVNYTQNSASVSTYSRTNITEASADIGMYNIGGSTKISRMFSRNTDGNMYAALNTITNNSITHSNATTGLYSSSRTASDLTTYYRNGISLGTEASASTTLDSANMFICAMNSNGTAASFSTRQYSCAAIKGGSVNELSFYNAIQSYMVSIGANV